MIRHGVLVITLLLSVIALLLCVMAHSMESESTSLLSLGVDYGWIGWVLRVSGGVVAGAALFLLIPVRRAVRQKSLAGLMAKTSLLLSLASLFWEVAVPLVIVLVVSYGILSYFSDD